MHNIIIKNRFFILRQIKIVSDIGVFFDRKSFDKAINNLNRIYSGDINFCLKERVLIPLGNSNKEFFDVRYNKVGDVSKSSLASSVYIPSADELKGLKTYIK